MKQLHIPGRETAKSPDEDNPYTGVGDPIDLRLFH
jgi:hypothetical protein